MHCCGKLSKPKQLPNLSSGFQRGIATISLGLSAAGYVGSWDMPDIEFIRTEILRTRLQVLRHRNEIMQLQRDGLPTTSAEALFDRMLNKIDDLCDERNRLSREQHRVRKRGRRW
jgi:hypothetical protein